MVKELKDIGMGVATDALLSAGNIQIGGFVAGLMLGAYIAVLAVQLLRPAK